MFAQAPVGLAFWDESLRCVRVNGALAAMMGAAPGGLLGRRPAEVAAELGERLEIVLRTTLRTARPRADIELTGRLPADPGTTHTWLASTFAIPGSPVRVGAVIADQTARKRVERERRRLLAVTREAQARAEAAERRFAFLASAGKLLAEALDMRETLDLVAKLTVPEVADWCFVELLQDDGSIKRVAMAAADPLHATMIEALDARYPLDPDAPFGSPQVIRTGEALLLESIPEEAMAAVAQDDDHVEILRALDFGAVIIVPLRARGRILGDIALTAGRHRGFDAEDLEVAQELADRCALAVDNARLYELRAR